MIKNRKITLVFWILVFIWMTLIFYSSSQVADRSNELSKGVTQIIVETIERVAPEADFDTSRFNHLLRKNAHFFAYLVLGVLVMNALKRSGIDSIRWVFLICVLYAISDEIHQVFVPGRGPQVKDVFIDSAGAIVGIGMYKVISQIKKTVMTSKF